MQPIDMETYFTNLARKHYVESFTKDKDSLTSKEKYYKCWVNDMANVLMDYKIDLTKFITNLINN